MSQHRELIYSTLFQQLVDYLLAGTPGRSNGAIWTAGSSPTLVSPFLTGGRRKQPLGSLAANQYPAFWLIERGEQYRRTLMGGPANITLISYVQIETMAGADPNSASATQLNNLADAVEDAVEGPLSGTNQLDGLVLQSWISGREVITLASGPGTWSIQLMEIETILWGPRTGGV